MSFMIIHKACITQSLWSVWSLVRCLRSMPTVIQNLPQIRSHTVSTYGLYGKLVWSVRSCTVARTACMVARTVSAVGLTVYTVSCYGLYGDVRSPRKV